MSSNAFASSSRPDCIKVKRPAEGAAPIVGDGDREQPPDNEGGAVECMNADMWALPCAGLPAQAWPLSVDAPSWSATASCRKLLHRSDLHYRLGIGRKQPWRLGARNEWRVAPAERRPLEAPGSPSFFGVEVTLRFRRSRGDVLSYGAKPLKRR